MGRHVRLKGPHVWRFERVSRWDGRPWDSWHNVVFYQNRGRLLAGHETLDADVNGPIIIHSTERVRSTVALGRKDRGP